LMVLFAAGFLFALIRYLVGLGQIVTIIRKSERQTFADNTVLCVTDKDISPFSWMKYIVLSHKELSADNRAIIRHEKAHIHLRHSWDMIFFDLFSCLFWFNPFSWLLRREIQSVHEYQADQQVLLSGIDTRQYQLLLIRKSVGEYKFALANNFRQRDLQKRITMMKKSKTNRRMKWNYAMALPILFLAMIALSVPKLNAGIPEKKSNEAIEKETAVSPQTRDSIMISVLGNVDLDTDPLDLGKTKIVPEDSALTIDSKENGNIVIRGYHGKSRPLMIVDEKRITADEFKKIKPDDIESISVLKDKTAIDIYGDDAKDGVVIITTKNSNKNVIAIGPGSMDSIRGDVKGLIISTKENSPQYLDLLHENPPLIIVDGEKMTKDFDVNSISPADIESLNVLKDKTATDRYGEDGKNGVISIMTKENLQSRVGIDDRNKKVILKVVTYKTGEVVPFGDFSNTEIFIDGRKSSLEQLQQLNSKDVKGMAVASQDLDFESDLHKKYKIARNKSIVEVTVK
uniref:M56 family metallopeptidase n=1 Tax=uncultured Proteiniphilum sp. TaxID=497637 RepID=UPI00260C24F6